MEPNFSDAGSTAVSVQIDGVYHSVSHASILARDGQIATLIAEWIDDGGVIQPYAAPPLTADDYARAIQAHVDATAKAKGYADGVALAGYSTSTIPSWASEAAAFIAWRDQAWMYAYGELAKVQAGQRTAPTVNGFLSELPAIAWPA